MDGCSLPCGARQWACVSGVRMRVEENLCPARGSRRTATYFPCNPEWVSGCLKPLNPSSAGGGQGAVLDTRFSASGIPDTAGHHGRAENRMGAGSGGGVDSVSPWAEERRGQGRGIHCVVPMQARILGLVHGWSTGRPSGRRLDTALRRKPIPSFKHRRP